MTASARGWCPLAPRPGPTDSIRFGPVSELIIGAKARVRQLHEQGETGAFLYGADDTLAGGLNAFYLLVDRPRVYGLPESIDLEK